MNLILAMLCDFGVWKFYAQDREKSKNFFEKKLTTLQNLGRIEIILPFLRQ